MAIIGAEVLYQLTRFSKEAAPGAMLTIRCTRDGFTAQVTGPIVGGSATPLTFIPPVPYSAAKLELCTFTS